jgi:hypothetical protein
MIEKDTASSFDDSFKHHHIIKPNNRQAGWPDRGVQLDYSRIIWFELKTTQLRKDGKILVNNFEPSQAAFMLQWQRFNGFCYLLTSVLDRKDDLIGHALITTDNFKDWLNVRNRLYDLNGITFKERMEDVYEWFTVKYNPQYKDRFKHRET